MLLPFFAGLFLLFIFFASRLELSEDIADALPRGKGLDVYSNYFNKIKVSEKIIINISSKYHEPGLLEKAGDSINAKFERNLYPRLVKEINYRFSQDKFLDLYDFMLSNLPIFLDSEDYANIDSVITADNIRKTIQANYRSLMSPAGFATKKFISGDPLSLAIIPMKKLQNLNISDSYITENDRLYTKDHGSLVIFVLPVNSASETSKNSEMISLMQSIFDEVIKENNGKVDISIFGAAPVAVSNASQLKNDIILTVSLGFGGIFLFVFWYYRRLRLAVLSFLPAIFGASMSLALIYLIKGSMSAIALGAGSIILGIIVDYAFYLVNNYRLHYDAKKVVEEMSFTLIICSITSMTAFFCLLFVKSPILQDLGLFAGISVFGAALFTLTAMPHILPFIVGKKESVTNLSIDNRFIRFPFDRNKFALVLFLLISVSSFFYFTKAGFETDMSKMNFISPELKEAESKINKDNEALLKSVFLISKAKTLDSALDNLGKASPALKKLKQEDLIKQYALLSDFLPSENVRKERLLKWMNYWTKSKIATLKENIIKIGKEYSFSPSAFNSFFTLFSQDFQPANLDSSVLRHPIFNEFINFENDTVYISSIVKVDQENRNKLLNKLENISSVAIFDKQQFANEIVSGIKDDFELLVNLAFLLVTIVIFLTFGRFELGLIVAAPMFLSWLITLAFMGLTGINFNIFNIIISTFIFGLGTDYSILIMRGLQNEFRYGTKELTSFKSSVTVSSATTIIGVGVLIFAKHPSLNSIALISIVGMGTVVLISFILQPLAFRFLTNNRKRKRTLPLTLINLFFTAMTLVMFFIGCVIGYVFGHLVFTLFPFTKRSRRIKYVYHWMMAFLCGIDVRANFHIKKRIIKSKDEDFSKPAVIICNHQSHVDIPLFIMMNPKVILLTNDWVWNSPFFGSVIRFADYYPISWGYENSISMLEDRVREGYSIVIFPEGTRSVDGDLGRFHKGAFFIAEKLNLDILPVMMHGSGQSISKGELMVKKSAITIKFLDRIKNDDLSFGETYSERTKLIAKFYKKQFAEFRRECDSPRFFRDKVLKNYIYKGPVLEWYVRSKLIAENDYSLFNELLPRKGKIIDFGCGYGYLDYMLAYISRDRHILAYDLDDEKINIASNGFNKPENLKFVCSDILETAILNADAYLFSDVLHYMSYENQLRILGECVSKLNDNGIILVRDSNSELGKRNSITKFTELISTYTGFNKANFKDMCFETEKSIRTICEMHNCTFQIIDSKGVTSNVLYLIKKGDLN